MGSGTQIVQTLSSRPLNSSQKRQSDRYGPCWCVAHGTHKQQRRPGHSRSNIRVCLRRCPAVRSALRSRRSRQAARSAAGECEHFVRQHARIGTGGRKRCGFHLEMRHIVEGMPGDVDARPCVRRAWLWSSGGDAAAGSGRKRTRLNHHGDYPKQTTEYRREAASARPTGGAFQIPNSSFQITAGREVVQRGPVQTPSDRPASRAA